MKIEEIRERISKTIKESSLTQIEIAKQLGVRQTTISEYVRYKSLPALDTLAKLCVILDVSADYLLGLTDEFGNPTFRNADGKNIQISDSFNNNSGKISFKS